ncbi:SRPBCC domain-containing protein [Streptomyces sp. KLOTTS4A1]|uniref:SRPBCC domain-containing protein n=1 Tax=Streptomyces sp. KLOTTS4A1 TaxID=3390996 RepID=UPI0039F51B12
MESEVFVPVPEAELRHALGDPEAVARSVPGLQRAADGGPLEGRLKVRIGGHTITYRGTAQLTERGDAYAIEGDATEVRGSGSVQLALQLRLVPGDGGTTLAFSGGAKTEGRAAQADTDAADSAARRLLRRFAERLGQVAAEADSAAAGGSAAAASSAAARDGGVAEPGESAGPGESGESGESAESAESADTPTSAFDSEVPPPAFARDQHEALADELDEVFGDVPGEATHARRTMIGRSAEEVDHAPPRGRYAPVPAPDSGSAADTLRWVAPAAALVVASAVVVGRILRRRR